LVRFDRQHNFVQNQMIQLEQLMLSYQNIHYYLEKRLVQLYIVPRRYDHYRRYLHILIAKIIRKRIYDMSIVERKLK